MLSIQAAAILLPVSLCASSLAPAPAPRVIHDEATSLPIPFESVQLPGEFDLATAMVFAPDGSFFVAQKQGLVRSHDGAAAQVAPVIDLESEVLEVGDRGIMGIALHPGFTPDGGSESWIYLLYSVSPVDGQDAPPGTDDMHTFSRLTRYRVETVGTDRLAVLPSRQVLLGTRLADGTIPDGIASIQSHPCGSLRFGHDGSLLVSTGDGAHVAVADFGGLDPSAFDDFTHPQTGLSGPFSLDQDSGAFRSQDVRSLCGKILRIDPETGAGYPSNPYFDGDAHSNPSRVWALGFRNPFRFSVLPNTGSNDPNDGDPGELLVGDVGSAFWEEVNLVRGGENFGWPCFEGPFPNDLYSAHTHQPNPLNYPDCGNVGPGALTFPVTAWRQNDANALVPSGVYTPPAGSPFSGFSGSCAMGGTTYPGGSYPGEYAGRYFFSDFADGWIRTLELDPAGTPVQIEDFGFDIPGLVDMAVHPLTGDLHYVSLSSAMSAGHVHRIRISENLAPIAVASATPMFGAAPLEVQFTSAGSSDPEQQPLTFSWDFDDGSPTSNSPSPLHTFTTPGVRNVTVVASDGENLSSVASLQIGVGESPPTSRILSPAPGQLFDAPETILLVGEASDAEGTVSIDWNVDLFHETHVHPQAFVSTQLSDSLEVTPHTLDGELYYFRVTLTATDESGLQTSSRVFIYPRENVADETGRATFLTRLHALNPPVPLGASNTDPEVIRDADFPPLGSGSRERQYDTQHNGDQGADDWIGFALPYVPRDDARFVSLTFQEGLHTEDGGWWESFSVEVRDEGEWVTVENLQSEPDYPFELASQSQFDGQNYDTYRLTFDPAAGDAIRIRGNPGGSGGYVSIGELRFELLQTVNPAQSPDDLTHSAEFIASVPNINALPSPGQGSFLFQTQRNGTFLYQGDDSRFGSVATSDPGHPPGEHWLGYTFDPPVTASRIVFQEGLHDPGGGWFETLDVEVRAPGGSWMPATGLSSCPPYSAASTQTFSYETFVFDFDPQLVDGVRIIGQPGGAEQYVSVGELRVYSSPMPPDCCGPALYGVEPGGSDQITLRASVPIQSDLPFFIHSDDAPGIGFGLMLFTLAATDVVFEGVPLLIAPPTLGLLDLLFDGGGSEVVGPITPFGAVIGVPVYFQAVWVDPVHPGELRLSNGLSVVACP